MVEQEVLVLPDVLGDLTVEDGEEDPAVAVEGVLGEGVEEVEGDFDDSSGVLELFLGWGGVGEREERQGKEDVESGVGEGGLS